MAEAAAQSHRSGLAGLVGAAIGTRGTQTPALFLERVAKHLGHVARVPARVGVCLRAYSPYPGPRSDWSNRPTWNKWNKKPRVAGEIEMARRSFTSSDSQRAVRYHGIEVDDVSALIQVII